MPNRVPNERSTRTIRKQENPAGMRDCGWRDPDSNRGHHDFQSRTETPLTRPKVLQFSGFSTGYVTGLQSANCALSPPIVALRCALVPSGRVASLGRRAGETFGGGATAARSERGRPASSRSRRCCFSSKKLKLNDPVGITGLAAAPRLAWGRSKRAAVRSGPSARGVGDQPHLHIEPGISRPARGR